VPRPSPRLLLLLAAGLALGAGALWQAWPRPRSAVERLAGDDPELRLGRQKLQSFCLACHMLDGPPEVNPLAPKVRGWTREDAYRNVARLDQLSSAMILNFTGSDEERHALARTLELLGQER